MNDTFDILGDLLGVVDDTPLSFREFVTSPDYLGSSSFYEWWLNKLDPLPVALNM